MAHNKTTIPKKKNTSRTGDIGERVAVKHLKNLGFKVIETNYWQKWGELDIVAIKEDIVHFIEVKTVSYETKSTLQSSLTGDNWRPEELVHARKLHQISKAVQTWLSQNKHTGEFCIDVIAVRMVPHEKYATVEFIENVAV